MLNQIFEAFHLGERESQVYLALLECGAITAGNLAKSLTTPRSSLYDSLAQLADLGLVSQSQSAGVKLWHAESPDRLMDLANRRINDWEGIRSSVDSILPGLKSREATDYVAPQFHYFEGVEGVRHMLEDILLYRDLETQAFWPIRDMLNVLGDRHLATHNVQRIRQNISLQAIWPESKTVDIAKLNFLGVGKEFKREIRQAPPGIESAMGYWAYRNKVAFVASQRELFGFIVESSELRQMLKTQFDLLWGLSKRIEVPFAKTKSFFDEWS